MKSWDYLNEADFYSRFDPQWDDTLNWIIMLPEVGESL